MIEPTKDKIFPEVELGCPGDYLENGIEAHRVLFLMMVPKIDLQVVEAFFIESFFGFDLGWDIGFLPD